MKDNWTVCMALINASNNVGISVMFNTFCETSKDSLSKSNDIPDVKTEHTLSVVSRTQGKVNYKLFQHGLR